MNLLTVQFELWYSSSTEEQQRKDTTTNNKDRKHGGARAGSGPPPFGSIIGGAGAIYLRELTRRRLGRRDVTRTECAETLAGVLAYYGQHDDLTGLKEAIRNMGRLS